VTAEKRESQEVCFAPKGTYPDFLKSRFPELARPGPILDSTGKTIGRHPGIIHFTIGQRRRIGVAAARPYYVTAIDPTANSITVGHAPEARSAAVKLTELNLVSVLAVSQPFRARVQIRYRHAAASAQIEPAGGRTLNVTFDDAQWAITPGQAAVIYDGDTVVAGGIIVN
jgi:tRNA-specific 2-thiouridylase